MKGSSPPNNQNNHCSSTQQHQSFRKIRHGHAVCGAANASTTGNTPLAVDMVAPPRTQTKGNTITTSNEMHNLLAKTFLQFYCRPTESNKHNLHLTLLSSLLLTLSSHATNSTCHNLCTHLLPPLFFQSLLGLSLKFCPCLPKTTTTKQFLEVKECF